MLETDPRQAERLAHEAFVSSIRDYPDAQLVRCRAFAQLGMWNEALGLFGLIEDPTACPPAEMLALGRQAVAGRDAPLAHRAFEAADQPGPHQADVVKAKADLAQQLGDNATAAKELLRLQELAPNSGEASRVMATLREQQGDFLAAAESYQEALARELNREELSQAQRGGARVWIGLGDAAKARPLLEACLQRSPNDAEVRLLSGKLLRLEGEPQQALEEFSAAIDLQPSLAEAFLHRGIVLLDQGNAAPAAEALEQCVRLEPYNKEAHFKLSLAYQAVGDDQSSARHLETSRRLTAAANELVQLMSRVQAEPNNQQLRAKIASLFEELGRTDVAQSWRQAE